MRGGRFAFPLLDDEDKGRCRDSGCGGGCWNIFFFFLLLWCVCVVVVV